MTPRERQLIKLIERDPFAAQEDLAASLGISRSAVAGHVMRLTERGVIRGRGYILESAATVVCIGATNLDLHATARIPLEPGRSTPGDVRRFPGGAARNVAENLARLGVRCRLLSVVGSDPDGDFLLEHAQRAGIDVSGVMRSTAAATSTYVALFDAAGESRLAINDMQLLNQLDAAWLARHARLIANAGLLVVDGNIGDTAASWLADHSGAAPIFADSISPAKAPRLLPLLPKIHTLKTSLDDARAMAGRRFRTADSAAGWLVRSGVKRAFLTSGAAGVRYRSADGERGSIPGARAPEIVSESGAGDAFLAGLAFSALHSEDLPQSTAMAGAAAARTLAIHGNVAESIGELRDRFA